MVGGGIRTQNCKKFPNQRNHLKASISAGLWHHWGRRIRRLLFPVVLSGIALFNSRSKPFIYIVVDRPKRERRNFSGHCIWAMKGSEFNSSRQYAWHYGRYIFTCCRITTNSMSTLECYLLRIQAGISALRIGSQLGGSVNTHRQKHTMF